MTTEYYAEFEVTDNSGNSFVIRNVTPYRVPNTLLNSVGNVFTQEDMDYIIAIRMQQDLLLDTMQNSILEAVSHESREAAAVDHPKLTVTQFNNLASKRFCKDFKNEGFKQTDCVICGDGFRSNQKLPIIKCGHHFHWKCLKEWVTKHRASCPICMGEIKSE